MQAIPNQRKRFRVITPKINTFLVIHMQVGSNTLLRIRRKCTYTCNQSIHNALHTSHKQIVLGSVIMIQLALGNTILPTQLVQIGIVRSLSGKAANRRLFNTFSTASIFFFLFHRFSIPLCIASLQAGPLSDRKIQSTHSIILHHRTAANYL